MVYCSMQSVFAVNVGRMVLRKAAARATTVFVWWRMPSYVISCRRPKPPLIRADHLHQQPCEHPRIIPQVAGHPGPAPPKAVRRHRCHPNWLPLKCLATACAPLCMLTALFTRSKAACAVHSFRGANCFQHIRGLVSRWRLTRCHLLCAHSANIVIERGVHSVTQGNLLLAAWRRRDGPAEADVYIIISKTECPDFVKRGTAP